MGTVADVLFWTVMIGAVLTLIIELMEDTK